MTYPRFGGRIDLNEHLIRDITSTCVVRVSGEYLGGIEQRNCTAYLELVAIALARVHFKSLDDLARATGEDSTALLDAAEAEAQEGLDGGSWTAARLGAAGRPSPAAYGGPGPGRREDATS